MNLNYDEMSIKQLKKMNHLRENSLEYNITLGEKSITIGNWTEASEYAMQALEIDSKSIEALVILSRLQELKNDNNGAIHLLRKALDIRLTPNLFIKISELFLKDKLMVQAINEINNGIKDFPGNLQLLKMKCDILERVNNIDECKKTYEELISLSNDSMYHYDFAVFLRGHGFHEEAKNLFNRLKNKVDLPKNIIRLIERYLNETRPLKQNFKVGARLLLQLGEQMIENEIVAISELIKNSYDARSPIVNITVDTEYEERGNKIGKIIISDKGIGMTKDVIEQHWLLISTNMKLKQKNDNNSIDVPLGEKGVGRLSAHRLGHKLTVETTVKSQNTKTYLEVDWEKFEYNSELSIEDVDVLLSEGAEDQEKQYTTLIITKLRNPEFWLNLITNSKSSKDSRQQMQLQKALFSMISPYKEIQKAFKLNIIVNDIPLKIDNVDEDFLNTIGTTKLELDFFRNLNNEWQANIKTTLFPDFYALKSKPLEAKLREQDPKWLLKYLKHARLPINSVEFFDEWNQEKLLSHFKDLWELQLFGMQSPGNFKMVLYGFSRDKSMNERVNEGLAKLSTDNVAKQISAKDYFDSIKGVKIYRDGFRVFPYGEEYNDWLGLDQSATSSGTYDDLKSSNTTGYVALTGKENQKLREKTNREGFISDAYSSVFFKLCSQTIKLANTYIKREAENLRNISKDVTTQLNEELEQIRIKEEQEIENMRKSLLDAAENNDNKESDNQSVALTALVYTDKVSTHIKTSENQNRALKVTLDDLLLEMDRITELASFGMLVEAFTHEFELQSSKLNGIVKNLLREYSKDNILKKNFTSMQSVLNIMDGYIKYLTPSFQKERKRRIRLEMNMLINSIFGQSSISFIYSRAKRNNISINVTGDKDFIVLGNQGLLTQTFDNLYINSEYWLNDSELKGIITNKEFNVTLDSEEKKIFVWDNGPGIDINMETVLFDAFESGKPNNEGRGLGLYITKTALELMSIKIYLDNERNGDGKKFKFVIDFNLNGG